MNIQNRQRDFDQLRKTYPFFEYKSYTYSIADSGFKASFHFNISDAYYFSPSIEIPYREIYHWNKLSNNDLDNLVFHLGMIELISYWKLTCSPEIRILPHLLDEKQVQWWKKLYVQGLGEFLYLNGIDSEINDLFHIYSEGKPLKTISFTADDTKVMVPVGGGKDSVVTLELLRSGNMSVIPMAVNMRPAIRQSIENAGFTVDESLLVNRYLDPLMLDLNQQGFLNGHTPFSAMLAFLTVLLAAGSGIKYIALSNESSANQSTVPDTHINHQYSKSFEFEQDFDAYIHQYIHKEIKYFSFLRPINELQIAALFAGFKHHHVSFRSCNVGSKLNQWCGACPKCLFTYVMLSPFLKHEELQAIFGTDLLENSQLSVAFDELVGRASIKPFECVGTPDEVNAAIYKTFHTHKNHPLLLKNYNFSDQGERDYSTLMNEFSDEHHLSGSLVNLLKEALHDRLT